MLHEIRKDEYYKIKPLVKRLSRVALAGTLEGMTPGRVYVDDPQRPLAIFTWNEYRFSFLAGDPSNEAFRYGLTELLDGELLPEARQSSDPTVVLYPDSMNWINDLEASLQAHTPLRLYRSLYLFDRQVFEGSVESLEIASPDFELLPIDSGLSKRFSDLASPIELLWGDIQNFNAKGFGFCLIANGQVVSACYSAFCAGERAEISVGTDAAYRGRGLARQVSTAFICESLRRGLEPVWECWWENQASRALAQRLGFEWLEDYPVLFIDLAR